MITAASSNHGTGAQKRLRSARAGCGFSSSTRFGPNRLRRLSASDWVRPAGARGGAAGEGADGWNPDSPLTVLPARLMTAGHEDGRSDAGHVQDELCDIRPCPGRRQFPSLVGPGASRACRDAPPLVFRSPLGYCPFPGPAIVNLGPLSNLPAGPAVFEIQMLATDPTGNLGVSGRQSIGIHSFQLF